MKIEVDMKNIIKNIILEFHQDELPTLFKRKINIPTKFKRISQLS